jgi:hypothetical protein
MMPLPTDVAGFLGRGENPSILSLAGEHLPIVTTFVRAYTRGNGFDETGDPSDDLAAVIVTATARLLDNPTLTKSETVGAFSRTPGQLNGFHPARARRAAPVPATLRMTTRPRRHESAPPGRSGHRVCDSAISEWNRGCRERAHRRSQGD